MADLRIEDYPVQIQLLKHGEETEAPNAGQVLVDSGPYQSVSGFKIVKVLIAAQDSVPDYEVAHRDPTNTIDLEVAMIAAGSMPGQWSAYFGASQGDHFVVRTRSAGTAGKFYQASIFVGG